MAENVQRSRGTSKAYTTGAGGVPAESGPFIGIVKNNVDSTRSGKIEVYIEFLSGPDENNPDFWKPMSYISPFYGATDPDSPDTGSGSFLQNKHSYGMWYTPPDIGTRVICFFANGDPNQGYYLGSVVTGNEPHHMVPAIGSTSNYVLEAGQQPGYFANSTQLPVVEYNDENPAISEAPNWPRVPYPVHNYLAGVLVQQGLVSDNVRGTIGSNSYRESPSTVYGVSTPGRPIYSGGYSDVEITARLNQDANNPGSVPLQSMKVIGRRGGHSFIMDDGDINGNDQHVRIRTAKGHQIILTDSGDSLHIIHANGQSWVELGQEGTIDLFATNSVNIRSQGDINLHADASINMNSGSTMNLYSEFTLNLETAALQLSGKNTLTAYSEKYVGVKSDGSLALQNSKTGSWNGGSAVNVKAGCISLNSGSASSVAKPAKIPRQKLPDVVFDTTSGWTVEQSKIDTVATRAPTHEPYPLHGGGTATVTNITNTTDTAPTQPEVTEAINQSKDKEFNAIDASQYETQKKSESGVGSIAPEQVTGMLAQAKAEVPQAANVISDDIGVGTYGFSAGNLEKAGYLKPGTEDFYIKGSSANLSTVLSSPDVWSGKDGVTNVSLFLTDEGLQDETKTALFKSSLDDLRAEGVVTGAESPEDRARVVSATSLTDAKTFKSYLKNEVPVETKSSMDKAMAGGTYSVQLVDQKISESIQGYNVATPTGTKTIRKEVDEAVTTTINTTKTLGPTYTRTSAPRVSNARTAELERQINNVTKVEIPAAKEAYLNTNPGKKFVDFLRSDAYKTLVKKRDALQAQLEAARRG
jgi:hypothetical protein